MSGLSLVSSCVIACTRTHSLTGSCLARPAGAPAVASVASPAVSRVRSYAEVASAACDDAVALHGSSLCSRNSGGTGLHPEGPGIQFVSPGYGLDVRQSMGWTKVCGTTRSGIWVLMGIARTCMFPANLDHLLVEWMKRGSYKTAWVTPGHDCLCSYKYEHGAAVRPQTNNAIWDGVFGLWGRVEHFLSPWCGKKDVPTEVNLNQYAGPGSLVRWHSDNDPLFGPQNSPNLIVSLSLSGILWSSRCVVARRVVSPLRFGWTMVTFWSWMVWPNRSMNTARRLSCRVRG